jgi:hypothetical protein
MKSINLLVICLCLLAACTPVTQNTSGEVVLRGDEVIVVGPTKHGRSPYPTKRMIEQAKEACPTARFVNARPSMSNPSRFDFLFDC